MESEARYEPIPDRGGVAYAVTLPLHAAARATLGYRFCRYRTDLRWAYPDTRVGAPLYKETPLLRMLRKDMAGRAREGSKLGKCIREI